LPTHSRLNKAINTPIIVHGAEFTLHEEGCKSENEQPLSVKW